ncbi:MAG: hypothetical protein ACLTUM_01650 [Christensenellales bacterium]
MRSIDMQAKKQKSEQLMKNEKGSGRERLLPLLHYLLHIAALLVLFQKKSAAYARLSAEISERISNQFFFRTEIINTA